MDWFKPEQGNRLTINTQATRRIYQIGIDQVIEAPQEDK